LPHPEEARQRRLEGRGKPLKRFFSSLLEIAVRDISDLQRAIPFIERSYEAS
jgi:hypothetical protein